MIRGSSSWSLVGWIISFSSLSTIAICLRFWSARIQERKLFMDDAFALVAYVIMIVQQVLAAWAIHNGLGNPSSDLTAAELVVQAKALVGISATWISSTTAIKLAILALYIRIFTTPVFKRCAVLLMILSTCYGITFLVVQITRCNPVSQEWAPVSWGWCRPLSLVTLPSIVLNLALDVAIVGLPMPWLWNLHLPLGRKIAIMFMFSFGFATIAIMCYRLKQTISINADPMLAVVDIGLLSELELWLGIIVACLLTMTPFFKTYLQPMYTWLLRRFRGASRSTELPRKREVNLVTFGRTGAPHVKKRNDDSRLLRTGTRTTQTCDEVDFVGKEVSRVQTDCTFAESHGATEHEDRLVQKEFETSNA